MARRSLLRLACVIRSVQEPAIVTFADLHLHSNHSDGSDAPELVAKRAAELGIGAIALTDHDIATGNAAAESVCRSLKLEFLPGIEISADFEGREIHILGLGIDPESTALREALQMVQDARSTRAERIVARLHARGIPISIEEVTTLAANGLPGRMHIARVLFEKGIVKTPQQAFDRFLNAGKPGHVGKTTMPTEDAIGAIHAAGGLAFVAHPGLGHSVRRALPRLLRFPFDGIEVCHPSHSPGLSQEFRETAKAHGLLVTGGSDCHGMAKGRPEMGRTRLPWEDYLAIRERLAT